MSNRQDEEIVQHAVTVAKLAASSYDVSNNGASRDLNIGPYSEGGSVHFQDNKLATSNYQGMKIDGVGQTHESHSAEYGLFSTETHDTKSANIGGFFSNSQATHKESDLTGSSETTTNQVKIGDLFKSEENTYKESGAGGVEEGRDVTTTCCGLQASSSERSYCCTSEACCGYRCSTTWCGETVSLRCDTVCCFRPICNLFENINCPSVPEIPACSLPNLDAFGNCVTSSASACQGVLSRVDLSCVVDCLQQVGPIICGIVETVASFVPED